MGGVHCQMQRVVHVYRLVLSKGENVATVAPGEAGTSGEYATASFEALAWEGVSSRGRNSTDQLEYGLSFHQRT